MQKVKKIPQRQCVGCRTKRDKKDLLRILPRRNFQHRQGVLGLFHYLPPRI